MGMPADGGGVLYEENETDKNLKKISKRLFAILN